ncbi:MAG: hypothetical protein ACM3US_06280 [Sphingomonadaceae bacterium]
MAEGVARGDTMHSNVVSPNSEARTAGADPRSATLSTLETGALGYPSIGTRKEVRFVKRSYVSPRLALLGKLSGLTATIPYNGGW